MEINLENANIHSPIFIFDNQNFLISETVQPGTPFGTVYAYDLDNDEIEYEINETQFSIEPTTGVLRLEKPFDSSSPSQYYVNITASDNRSSTPSCLLCPSKTNSTTITIIVTAVNKNSPRFLEPICGKNISFSENNELGANIVNFTVYDGDRAENGAITLSFPSEQLRTAGDYICH